MPPHADRVRPFPLAFLCCAMLGWTSGCSVAPRLRNISPPPAADGGSPDAAMAAREDDDQDGLCNSTEQDVGSNPDALDTDDDGYPDVIEVLNAFDASDPESPGQDQVGFLMAERNGSYEFETRATVDGEGEGYSGSFAAYATINALGLNAEDFLANSSAVSAEPPDNVRGVDTSGEHFESVLGHTRLLFRVRFEYDKALGDFECAEGFAFSYGVKTDLGERLPAQDYMLVVTPPGASGLDAKGFCLPEGCI